MAVFLLVRHGHNDVLGRRITGRQPGVDLNARGRAQAEALAERLADYGIDFIFSSPLARARQTAEPVAARIGIPVQVCEAINEIAFGEWEGRTLEELAADPGWQNFNRVRSVTRPPGGELMCEVQARMVGAIEALRVGHPQSVLALFSHGDPIKAALAHYMELPLDFVQRLEVSPASVSVLSVEDWGPGVLGINLTQALPRVS